MRTLTCVSITVTPISSDKTFNYFSVIGCSYIFVFIAGATIIGLAAFHAPNSSFLNGQARKIFVSILSHKPFEILARVFALKGAIKKADASFCSSIWRTGSPLPYQAVYSSSSEKEAKSGLSASKLSTGNSYSLRPVKWVAGLVDTKITLKLRPWSPLMIWVARMLATLPVTPKTTVLSWL